MSALFSPLHRGGAGPPLVCLHGFTDTWRSWELVLPALEHERDVLAPTLAGHAGGPPIDPAEIRCPVRVVWGTADRVLTWPGAAARFTGR